MVMVMVNAKGLRRCSAEEMTALVRETYYRG